MPRMRRRSHNLQGSLSFNVNCTSAITIDTSLSETPTVR